MAKALKSSRLAEDVDDQQTMIMFDLETTGFSRENDEIVEIAAWVDSGEFPDKYSDSFKRRGDVFHSFIYPTKNNYPRTLAVNGIRVAGRNQFIVRDVRHASIPSLHDVLRAFIKW